MKNKLKYQLHCREHSFKKKVENAKRIVEKNIDYSHYVSWSGGKDSNVVLHLCTSFVPDIPVLYIKSGYAIPESYQFMQKLVKDMNLNYNEIQIDIDYMELCVEFGLPHLRSPEMQKKIVTMIKKNPANEWTKAHKFTGMFWGLRAEESLKRKAFLQYKGRKYIDKNGIERISPIIDFTINDVWAYHYANDLPINPIYLKENCGQSAETIRNTGWLSTDGENSGRIQWLRTNYPEQFQKIRELL